MPGSYLLDTNIVIALMLGDGAVLEHLGAVQEVFIPVVAVGELYYGARKSDRADDNLARIDALVESCMLLGCDRGTAREYGIIKNGLKERGRPIPENDIWIAAVARQFGCILVSRDDHFAEVDGLTWEKW